LERIFLEDKERFVGLAYWSDEFVGTGAYRLRQFVRDSHAVIHANDRYVLGRPRIDEITVRFISDPNTIAANILAGEVDVTLGQAISLDEAIQVRDQWRDGTMAVSPIENALVIYPQLQNPTPSAIADVRFRRALLHALDRQELADSIQFGLAPVAHGIVPPHVAEYPDVEAGMVRYDYDPRRAVQLIETLGYSRAADGLFRDSAARRLAVELRVLVTVRVAEKAMPAVADYWQRVGVAVEAVPIPPQRARDGEWRITRPGFEMLRHSSSVSMATNLHSSKIPTAENRFAGNNYSRQASAEYDRLVERFQATIPWGQRMEILRQMVSHLTENVITMPVFYDMGPTLIAKRVSGVTRGTVVSNVHQWDVR
jgi:peptide/nickel transport system substrate-binding protein